jgi:hypothetical protein
MNNNYALENGYVRFEGRMFLALQISQHCKDQGLVHDVDYRWKMLGPTTFEFHFKDPSYASWIILAFPPQN